MERPEPPTSKARRMKILLTVIAEGAAFPISDKLASNSGPLPLGRDLADVRFPSVDAPFGASSFWSVLHAGRMLPSVRLLKQRLMSAASLYGSSRTGTTSP